MCNKLNLIEHYILYNNRSNGLYECVLESKKDLKSKSSIDFFDILDVLISGYFYSKNEFKIYNVRLLILENDCVISNKLNIHKHIGIKAKN